MYKPCVQHPRRLWIVSAILVAAVPTVMYAQVLPPQPRSPGRLNAQTSWELQLPSSATVSFKSFELLEGRIYATSTDGTIVCVRADTGEVAWIRSLADEFDTLWPPVAYRTTAMDAIAIARIDDVVFLDVKTGVPLTSMSLAKPSVSKVAVAPGRVFVNQPNGRLAAYRLRDGYVFWRAAFRDQFTTAPVYVPAINGVVAVDDVGLLVGMHNEHSTARRVLFMQHLRSEPVGELAMDGDMLYLTTANQTLHAIDMGKDEDSQAGDIVWQYRLAKRPQGGPVLCGPAIYQGTQDGGLHRIAKNHGELKNWFDPQAGQLLAQWPQGVVVLRADGSLALVGDDPERPIAVGSAGEFAQGLVNTANDAIFLTNPQGVIRCLRPVDAETLTLASFMPAADSAALPEEPDDPTEIDLIRQRAREKREKREGKRPEEVQVAEAEAAAEEVAPANAEAQAAPENAEAQAPQPAEPYDPLRSKRPVVR